MIYELIILCSVFYKTIRRFDLCMLWNVLKVHNCLLELQKEYNFDTCSNYLHFNIYLLVLLPVLVVVVVLVFIIIIMYCYYFY